MKNLASIKACWWSELQKGADETTICMLQYNSFSSHHLPLKNGFVFLNSFLKCVSSPQCSVCTELCINIPSKFRESFSKYSATHPKYALPHNISASRSQNLAGMILHYSVVCSSQSTFSPFSSSSGNGWRCREELSKRDVGKVSRIVLPLG